jgi:DNA-binding response OmpR family regulator
MKVLLVDDNNFSLKLLQKQLEDSGYEVTTAVDGIKALNVVRTTPPDIILLDVMMPRLDGYKVCKLLRMDERFTTLPIIMLTSKAGEEDRMLGLELGVNDFILKNADFQEIARVINKCLDQ